MGKIKKILKIAVVAIVALVVVVVAAISIVGGRILKPVIETAATKALNVKVSLGSIDLSILRGQISLENLSIDNPPGYQHPKLLELKKGKVGVDIKSLLSDTVKIKEIIFDGVNLTIEQKGISSNNLQEIISALPAGEKKASEPSGKKLLINNLEISNVTVNAKLLPIPGKSDTVTLKLAPIKMTNLGSDSKMDIAALSSKILLALTEGVAKQGAGLLPDDLTDTMKSSLDKAKKLGKTATEEGKKIIEKGKGLTEGLKGLFTPKSDK
jgi:hypothetical protein